MENFLSLPRSAKAGLTVLLAVALLGWGIVAYSAKRQHEDGKSLQQAVMTLDGKTATAQVAEAELEDAKALLATAETDLSTIMKDKTTLEDQVGKLEIDLGEREKAVTDLSARLQALEADAAQATDKSQTSTVASAPGTDVDVATLRERLTASRTTLSARSATLAQHDRELERVRAEYEAATAEIEALETDLVQQGVLRERLNTTMTKLSARTATLAQRDRELVSVRADRETAIAKTETLEAHLVQQGVLREQLTTTMTKLSGQRAMLAQSERTLARLREEHETTLAELDAVKAEAAAREDSDQAQSIIQLRSDQTKRALEEGANALAVNQQKIGEGEARLQALETEIDRIEREVIAKEQEVETREQALVELDRKIMAAEKKLSDLASVLEQRQREIGDVERERSDLETAKAKTEAEIASLTAELEQQENALGEKQDAIAYADTRLIELNDDVAAAEQRMAEIQTRLGQKAGELNDRQQDVKAVEATLSALKEDRATTATRSLELRTTINQQEAALKDLEIAKRDLEKTTIELDYQTKLLGQRQEQIEIADTRLNALQQEASDGARAKKTFAGIPIAALSSDTLAVLPVDPTYEPFPVQTPVGIRLTQVHFDMGSAELTPGALRKAKEAADWIKTQDVEKIRLVGFTDTIGTKANNRSLAKRRATSLLRVFEREGVDPNRIEIIAKGEVGAREVTDDHTAEPLNRCVGVFIGAGG